MPTKSKVLVPNVVVRSKVTQLQLLFSCVREIIAFVTWLVFELF